MPSISLNSICHILTPGWQEFRPIPIQCNWEVQPLFLTTVVLEYGHIILDRNRATIAAWSSRFPATELVDYRSEVCETPSPDTQNRNTGTQVYSNEPECHN